MEMKEIDKDIRRLKSEKKYLEILEKYGLEKYQKVVPKKYKKAHIEELFEEGRYEDIWTLYGKKEYNKLIFRMMEQDAMMETGEQGWKLRATLILARVPVLRQFIIRRVIPYTLVAGMSIGTGTIGGAILGIEGIRQNSSNTSRQMYSDEIDKYNERLEKYVDEIKKLNLDEFQTIMKVMDDQWGMIDGYGRLDVSENSSAVCRNLADDLTARLNAINPEYNARNMIVYLDSDALAKNGCEMADIETKLVNNTQDETQGDENDEQISANEYTGNHCVTAVDMPGKNITLIVDPTNPQLGVLINGKVHMFFNDEGEGIRIAPIGELFMSGTIGVVRTGITQALSFLPTEYTLDELEEMYGTDAQNKALQQIRNKEEKAKPFAERYAYVVGSNSEMEGRTVSNITHNNQFEEEHER